MTSVLGDQFTMIATPWLVLILTGDPLALGMVLALESIPRAILMLLGGAITDRFSGRTIMLLSDAIRLVLTALLAALTLLGLVNLWFLYVFGLLFGIVSAFFMPASGAIVPLIVEGDDLQAANSAGTGAAQLLSFLGPALAGAVIAAFGTTTNGGSAKHLTGIGVAYVIDTISFLISVITLWVIRVPPVTAGARQAASDVLSSIRAGFSYVLGDPVLRLLFLVIAAANFLFVGPLVVGIPVLANQRLPEGAAAYGLIIGAYGGGNLLGLLVATGVRRVRALGPIAVSVVALFGLGLIALGMISSTWVAFAIMLVVGIANGYIGIILITFMQRRTEKEMMGRLMSLIFFANVALVPVSQAVSGAAVKLSIEALFATAGVLCLLVALWTAFQPALKLLQQQVEETNQTGT